ncbi:trans-aconitate 2-methyltransferase [Saccharothrix lopnurensis]|uniref:Trans-aconitate 2-methyltransferase n=1 Tax=Saccharothrix lopnurensis TaxID=1670621 RepID=A0ABW1P4W8_9PSEU
MWDPARYLAFADHRSRPFRELVARVGATSPRRVVDLGCGPGNLTLELAERWPSAVVEALDSSPEMVAEARARGVDARVADVASWEPGPDVDVVVTNAVLQWVPGHEELLRGWVRALPSGAWLAVQVPGNFAAPSHRLVRDLVERRWPALRGLLRESPVLDPAGYAEVLSGAAVDAWETTYLQRLEGEDAVLEWITGTALRPVRAALDDEGWAEFRALLAPRLREVYPPRADGTTWFPFRRVFAVARVL